MYQQRVLLVGDDPILLKTRARLLEPLETVEARSSEAKVALLDSTFDVMIIGQTVSATTAAELIRTARMLRPAPALMAIRFPGEDVDLGIETHETNSWESAGWIKEQVMELLAERRSSLKKDGV
jgi:CheY-like chemotaxis protein